MKNSILDGENLFYATDVYFSPDCSVNPGIAEK